jgi:hypothetical protein
VTVGAAGWASWGAATALPGYGCRPRMPVTISPAARDEAPTLANLLELYAYDFTCDVLSFVA